MEKIINSGSDGWYMAKPGLEPRETQVQSPYSQSTLPWLFSGT